MRTRRQKADHRRPQGDAAIAARFRAARLKLGLSQAAVAERLGITRSAVVKIETLKNIPTLDWCYDAARILGLKPADLDPRLTERKGELPPPPAMPAKMPGGPKRPVNPEPEPLPDHVPLPD